MVVIVGREFISTVPCTFVNADFEFQVVYKKPYRRAALGLRLQPLGRVRRASKGILHTKLQGKQC